MACERLEGETLLEWDARCQGHEDGDSGEGTWSLVEGTDGKMYERNSKTGEVREAPPQFQKQQATNPIGDLLSDLAGIGLIPESVAEAGGAFNQLRTDAANTPYRRDPLTGLWVDRQTGNAAPQWVQEQLSGQFDGGGGAGDPYAANREARAAAADARAARAAALSETYDAMAAIRARVQAQQQAQLEAAPWAMAPGMSHFPGLSPTSALVTAGIADPVAPVPIAFNSGAVNAMNNPDQIAKDLAMVRRISGVG